jgi:hypothetical protein
MITKEELEAFIQKDIEGVRSTIEAEAVIGREYEQISISTSSVITSSILVKEYKTTTYTLTNGDVIVFKQAVEPQVIE